MKPQIQTFLMHHADKNVKGMLDISGYEHNLLKLDLIYKAELVGDSAEYAEVRCPKDAFLVFSGEAGNYVYAVDEKTFQDMTDAIWMDKLTQQEKERINSATADAEMQYYRTETLPKVRALQDKMQENFEKAAREVGFQDKREADNAEILGKIYNHSNKALEERLLQYRVKAKNLNCGLENFEREIWSEFQKIQFMMRIDEAKSLYGEKQKQIREALDERPIKNVKILDYPYKAGCGNWGIAADVLGQRTAHQLSLKEENLWRSAEPEERQDLLNSWTRKFFYADCLKMTGQPVLDRIHLVKRQDKMMVSCRIDGQMQLAKEVKNKEDIRQCNEWWAQKQAGKDIENLPQMIELATYMFAPEIKEARMGVENHSSMKR